MQSAGYPRNLSYLVKRLSGYSRNTFKLQTLNQTTASSGQIVTVDLPSNALVDLSTLTMFFRGTTTTSAGFAVFPRNIECLIERLEVEINGQLVNTGCAFYNHLWQIVADTTMGEDVTNRRKILQNANDVSAAPTANVTNVQYCIQNWLGFLSSCKPNVLDTSLLGNVRIRITLAGTPVLPLSASATGASYSLSDIFFSVDTLSIDDGMFYNMHQQFLAQGNVYEIPFNNYFSFTSTGGMTQATKFSLSTQSLNRVWATFTLGANYIVGGAAGSAFFDANAATSAYFTRVGNAGAVTFGTNTNSTPVTYALTNYQFNINNVYYPNYKPTAEQAYALLLNSYNLTQDTLGGGYKNLDSLAKWNASFWVAAQEFEHGSDDFISGIDTRGNIAQCFFETQGTVTVGANTGSGGTNPGTSLVALVFAQTTSTLRVGAGRQIELVM
jgi:hypothetical protein